MNHRRRVCCVVLCLKMTNCRYLAPELAGPSPKCSLASDVFSASLIVLEMATSVCVFVFAADEAEAAARAVVGQQARAAAKAAAVMTARRKLIAQATERLRRVLGFAFDSPLTLKAMELLMNACTRLDPAQRCSFGNVQMLCQSARQQQGGGARHTPPGLCATAAALVHSQRQLESCLLLIVCVLLVTSLASSHDQLTTMRPDHRLGSSSATTRCSTT